MELENVMAVGSVVPFDVGELTVVANVFVCEAAVQEQTGDISVLGLVGCVKLIGMINQAEAPTALVEFFCWNCGGGRQGLATLRRAGMVG